MVHILEVLFEAGGLQLPCLLLEIDETAHCLDVRIVFPC